MADLELAERFNGGRIKLSGSRIKRCAACPKNGGCEVCGGSGWTRECLNAECYEYGCGGNGFCEVPADAAARATPILGTLWYRLALEDR